MLVFWGAGLRLRQYLPEFFGNLSLPFFFLFFHSLGKTPWGFFVANHKTSFRKKNNLFGVGRRRSPLCVEKGGGNLGKKNPFSSKANKFFFRAEQ